ncbi:MAG: efflux RND transporter periplasmic adaptor subunit [Flavobacteriaceae bacterium]|nr:efflux RND transporter periplasmic adaptor subunit [Flavobacteriaceae bacterium]
MKNLYIILFSAIILTSCGGDQKSLDKVIEKGTLEELRTKKDEINADQLVLIEQMKQLDVAISKLDTIKKSPLITVFKAKKEKFIHFLELQGNVKTKQNVIVYPEMAGILTRVFVKEGQAVSKGQLLARIDDGGLGQQVAQMQIQAELAKTTFERQERLWNQKIGSEIEYLQAKSNYEGQQKVVNQLQSQLAKTGVRAPFSGVIDDVITDQGTVVSPGQSQIIRIVNLNDMFIETDVPESYITSVTKDKKVIVDFPILGKTVDTKVRQAGNFINPANRTYKVEIAVPNKEKNIKPNLTAKLKINDYTNEEAILIPQSVISENAKGQQYIYVVNDIDSKNIGISQRIIIETGKTQDDLIEVLSGIETGMDIIEKGARSVKEGQTVEIITKK